MDLEGNKYLCWKLFCIVTLYWRKKPDTRNHQLGQRQWCYLRDGASISNLVYNSQLCITAAVTSWFNTHTNSHAAHVYLKLKWIQWDLFQLGAYRTVAFLVKWKLHKMILMTRELWESCCQIKLMWFNLETMLWLVCPPFFLLFWLCCDFHQGKIGNGPWLHVLLLPLLSQRGGNSWLNGPWPAVVWMQMATSLMGRNQLFKLGMVGAESVFQ